MKAKGAEGSAAGAEGGATTRAGNAEAMKGGAVTVDSGAVPGVAVEIEVDRAEAAVLEGAVKAVGVMEAGEVTLGMGALPVETGRGAASAECPYPMTLRPRSPYRAAHRARRCRSRSRNGRRA